MEFPSPMPTDSLRIVPRPDAELEALEALVRSAVGFDEARGDSVTVDSMAFDEAVVADLVAPGFLERIDLDLGQLLRTVVLALVALVIAFGLVRPAFRNVANTAEGAGDLALPDGLASDVNLPPLPETTDSTGPTRRCLPRLISTRCRVFHKSLCPTSTMHLARVR
jgi:flagellar biosynthesis/type III secretory pathway M-ring protein FliF/YscJ